MKNIINIACAVIILLYSWLSAMYCTPGPDNSILIKTEKAVPSSPANNAKIKYNVPISFALLDQNQRSNHIEISDFITKLLELCVWLYNVFLRFFVLNLLKKFIFFLF